MGASSHMNICWSIKHDLFIVRNIDYLATLQSVLISFFRWDIDRFRPTGSRFVPSPARARSSAPWASTTSAWAANRVWRSSTRRRSGSHGLSRPWPHAPTQRFAQLPGNKKTSIDDGLLKTFFNRDNQLKISSNLQFSIVLWPHNVNYSFYEKLERFVIVT